MNEPVKKPIGSRVPFESGVTVWNKLDFKKGPWVVAEDKGGEKIKLYDSAGKDVEYPAVLLTAVLLKEKIPLKMTSKKKAPPVWLGVGILLTAVAAATGHILSEGNFRWAWAAGVIAFTVVIGQRIASHFKLFP